MNPIKELLSDGEQLSTYRVAMFVVLLPVMIVWAVICIRQNQFILPDAKMITLIISLFGGKVAQSVVETVSSSASKPETQKSNE